MHTNLVSFLVRLPFSIKDFAVQLNRCPANHLARNLRNFGVSTWQGICVVLKFQRLLNEQRGGSRKSQYCSTKVHEIMKRMRRMNVFLSYPVPFFFSGESSLLSSLSLRLGTARMRGTSTWKLPDGSSKDVMSKGRAPRASPGSGG